MVLCISRGWADVDFACTVHAVGVGVMLYYGTPDYDDSPDAWERDSPDWNTVYNFISEYMEDDIPGFVRDHIESDGDLWVEACESGVLDAYGAASWTYPKDPDKVWEIVEPFMESHWEDDEMMLEIWKWMPDASMEPLIKWLMRNADSNGIREKYNEQKYKERMSE
jgi:hypothetical protein